jgi:hypothetical protein
MSAAAASATVDTSSYHELQAGEEASGQKVSASQPCARYLVNLTRRSQVTVELRESNTASRCVLYISNEEPNPTGNNAMWSCEDSHPRKCIVMLPVDERFKLGPCYVVIRYLAGSGVVFFSLRITTKDSYEATWPFPKTLAIYSGQWELHKRHGKGVCLYYQDPEEYERRLHARHNQQLRMEGRILDADAEGGDAGDDGGEEWSPGSRRAAATNELASPLKATSGTGAANLSPAAVEALTRTVLMKGNALRTQREQQQHQHYCHAGAGASASGSPLAHLTSPMGPSPRRPALPQDPRRRERDVRRRVT